MERMVKPADGKKKRIAWMIQLWKAAPAIYFLFVFFLYLSFLSDPYFTDEQDVFFGAYNIIKGKDIYKSFLSQHMPFSYYIVALTALGGARTVFQFRVGIYLMLAILWDGIYLRHRKTIHPAALWLMPLLYLTILRTLYMGTTMISDHWQGIGLVVILLELVRYTDTKKITRSCAWMVSLGIALSLGSTFASAYSLFCYFLGMAAIQLKNWLQSKKSGQWSGKACLRENAYLAAVCLLPFLVLGGWYVLSGNVGNFYSGAYEIVTQVYSRYTGGLGSDPVRVVWETAGEYGRYLLGVAGNLAGSPWPGLLYAVSAAGLVFFSVLIGKKSPATGILVFLAAIYGGLRGFEGFHGMAYHAQAAAALALSLGWAAGKLDSRGKKVRLASGVIAGAAAACLLADFVIWTGYNLLYPQILLNRTLRCEEEILDLLTEPEETVFVCNAPVNSLDVMDLELIPADACGAISYPYFYEVWGERQMASIRNQPHVLLYNPDESIWGYVFHEYAPDFDAYVKEHYTRMPQAEEIWVANEFFPEAQQRLEKAGYGNHVVSNVVEITRNSPVKYFSGQRVETEFVAEGENLTGIRFCGACFYRRSRPTLTIRIKDLETGAALSEETITGEKIADNFYSRCPVQARLIPGKTYQLEIAVDRIEGKGDMEFYFTPEGALALAEEYDLNMQGETEI